MTKELLKTTLVHRGKAPWALDLGDGSERAEYVNQDYLLHTLGQPHRGIMLMYTYYPNDKEWPQRISQACKDRDIRFQWDYPYDDYFPYGGGPGGNSRNEPFVSMRDIRRHGQDVTLTLTIDCAVGDDHLRRIALDLKPFGRLRLRINHECAGTWFTHNKRFSHKEIGDFFVRFNHIIKETAPNIQTIFCAGLAKEDDGRMEYEDEFAEAYRAADIWSLDCYLALHYGWPYGIAEKNSGGYTHTTVDAFWQKLERTAMRLKTINGGIAKPLVISEFNTYGDVTGPCRQGDSIKRFAATLRDRQAHWFAGFTYYQFRDRGRLGLEREDPNNNAVGIPQPVLADYRQIMKDPCFCPVSTRLRPLELPARLRWGGSEDADGLELSLQFEKNPVFCEISFVEPLNLMMELGGTWFYKATGTRTVDLMPAFFKNPLKGPEILELRIFATPASGENDPAQGQDWTINHYVEIRELPELRIRYESVQDVD